MTYPLYNIATACAAPLGAAWIALRPKHRPLLRRFHPNVQPGETNSIWVHACSVGEINTARPILGNLRRRWPATPVVLTVSTTTGFAHATSLLPETQVTWCPFDAAPVVRSFIERLHPCALLLIETEIWPNILRECHRRAIPTVLVNGRISDRHFPRYVRWKRWLRPVMQNLSAACVQNDEYADRVRALGMAPSAVRVTGNTKFDALDLAEPNTGDAARLREEMGISADAPVLVFGSLRDGDDALAARCWHELQDRYPSLRLILAPRHLDTVAPTASRFGEPVLLRSKVNAGQRPNGERILLIDTLGELASFYALATVAVVCGSFFPGVNGHNPLEPAALGVPTVFGPYMRNFADPARELTCSGGALQVTDAEALISAVTSLLSTPESRHRMAACAREAIARNQGAIARTLDCLAPLLQQKLNPSA